MNELNGLENLRLCALLNVVIFVTKQWKNFLKPAIEMYITKNYEKSMPAERCLVVFCKH